MKKTKIKKDLSNKIKEIVSGNKVRGITLISLVVTIVILLILAGVAIPQLTGNGIFDKAKQAKDQYINEQEYEKRELENFELLGSNREIKKSELITDIAFEITKKNQNNIEQLTINTANVQDARIYYVYIDGEIYAGQYQNNVFENIGELTPNTSYTVKCGIVDKHGGFIESQEQIYTTLTPLETKKQENGPIVELYYVGNTYTALEYGTISENVRAINCVLKSGNNGASMSSTITGEIYGYANGEWELLKSNSVYRPAYTLNITIFNEKIDLEEKGKKYTNFQLRLRSTDNERYAYAELTPFK